MIKDCPNCETFTIQGEEETVYLYKPQWGGENYKLNKQLDSFDFWLGHYSLVDRGINNEPITLAGIEAACLSDLGFCIPICIPICANERFLHKFDDISNMMLNHEEVTISGLGDCVDAVYIIVNFTIRSAGAPNAYEWTMVLEYKRDI